MLLDAHGYSHYHENNLKHDIFAFGQIVTRHWKVTSGS